MVTPNSARPGTPAPEDSLCLTVHIVVLGSWGGAGGVLVEYGALSMILDTKVLNVLLLQSSNVFSPNPFLLSVQLNVPQHRRYKQEGGFNQIHKTTLLKP